MATKRNRRKKPAARRPAAVPPPSAPTPPPRPPAVTPAERRRARMADAPKAPWAPFPLVELTILAGIVLLVLGVVGVGEDRVAFVVCGLALISVASLELSLREHFAGFRSHSSLLAGAATVIVVILGQLLVDPPRIALIVVGVLVFAGCFVLLRRAFARRTGGIGFRV
jgi:hypothetical protein